MRTTLLFSLVILLAAAAPAAAAESSSTIAPLPEGLFAHIAVRTPGRLLETAGQVVAAITADTRQKASPKEVETLITEALPISLDSLKDGEDVHILLSADDPTMHAFLFHVDDYVSFAGELKELAATAEEVGDTLVLKFSSGFVPFFPIPNDEYRLSRIAGGLALLVYGDEAYAERFAAILSGWNPPPSGARAIAATVSFPEGWAFEIGPWMPYYMAVKDIRATVESGEMNDYLKDVKLDPQRLTDLFAATEFGFDAVLQALSSVRRFRMEVSATPEFLAVNTRAEADGDSTLAALIENLHPARPPHPASSLPGNDAAISATLAPPASLLPDIGVRLPEFIEAAVDALDGEKKEPARRIASVMASSVGEIAVAAYVRNYKQHYAIWVKSDDPQALLDSAMAGVKMFAETLDGMSADDASPARFTLSDGRIDGGRYERSRVVLSRRKAWFERLGGMERTSPMLTDAIHGFFIKPLQWLSFLAAVKGDHVVIVSGPDATGNDLALALKAVGDGARASSSAPTEKILDMLPNREVATIITDGDGYQLLKMLNERSIYPSSNYWGDIINLTLRNTIRQTQPTFSTVGEKAGIGIGSHDGALFVDYVIPVRIINSEFKNQEILNTAAEAEYHRLLRAYDSGATLEHVE